MGCQAKERQSEIHKQELREIHDAEKSLRDELVMLKKLHAKGTVEISSLRHELNSKARRVSELEKEGMALRHREEDAEAALEDADVEMATLHAPSYSTGL